jgi:hypothetical protein
MHWFAHQGPPPSLHTPPPGLPPAHRGAARLGRAACRAPRRARGGGARRVRAVRRPAGHGHCPCGQWRDRAGRAPGCGSAVGSRRRGARARAVRRARGAAARARVAGRRRRRRVRRALCDTLPASTLLSRCQFPSTTGRRRRAPRSPHACCSLSLPPPDPHLAPRPVRAALTQPPAAPAAAANPPHLCDPSTVLNRRSPRPRPGAPAPCPRRPPPLTATLLPLLARSDQTRPPHGTSPAAPAQAHPCSCGPAAGGGPADPARPAHAPCPHSVRAVIETVTRPPVGFRRP